MIDAGSATVTAPRRPLFSVAVYAAMLVLLVVHVAGAILLLPWTLAFDRDRRATARFGSWLVRTALRVPRRWRPMVRALGAVDLTRPAVIVVNHRSLADIAVAVAVPGAPRLLAKPWVARVPLFLPAMRLSGHVIADTGDLADVRDALDRMEGLLRRGTSVLLFPEGTRQRTPGLGRFHAGAFDLAVRAGVDVLPLVFHRMGDLVPPGRLAFRDVEPGLTLLPRIPPGTDRDALAARVRTAMAAAG